MAREHSTIVELISIPSSSPQQQMRRLISLADDGKVAIEGSDSRWQVRGEISKSEIKEMEQALRSCGLCDTSSVEIEQDVAAIERAASAGNPQLLAHASHVKDGGEFILRFNIDDQSAEIRVSNPDFLAATYPQIEKLRTFCRIKNELLSLRRRFQTRAD